mmetsp:Transcript_133664/g.333582  ORF Transcript_133664/g.333582 Transcript_133664/m.333582 type:complete len:91 (+) Transcript_133664:469-741(+)
MSATRFPSSSGAMSTDQMLNCVRLCALESIRADPGEDPSSMSGSLKPPGPAAWPSSPATLDPCWQVIQLTQSEATRQEFAIPKPPRESVA